MDYEDLLWALGIFTVGLLIQLIGWRRGYNPATNEYANKQNRLIG